eukprot:TRINITY_DN93589_c0_g1_i1.p1 TRINITY_DN93589_c0_g1~~TRINITY_DN93589_c0_g1_i1.p1  ORF type:complete len:546 (+),score=67.14 TRINITY_DN93589_c0_g1_i1:72-1709(+)
MSGSKCETEFHELPGPSLTSKMLVCQEPLVLLVPDFLPASTCNALLSMCSTEGDQPALLDPDDIQAPWTNSQRQMLIEIEKAIGFLTGQAPHSDESPISCLVEQPQEAKPTSFPGGLCVDANDGCPRCFATAVLYLTTPVGGQTCFPLAAMPSNSACFEAAVPISHGRPATSAAIDASQLLMSSEVLHTHDAKAPEAVAATSQLLSEAEAGTGLAAMAKQGSLLLFWCRGCDGSPCARSWRGGMHVGPGGEPKYVVQKSKAIPQEIWNGGKELIAAYVRATRAPHMPQRPHRTDDGITYFQANPYQADGRALTGGVLWDSGLALAKFLVWREATQPGVTGKRALELGAGTGVVGLTLGMLGCSVKITDCEDEILALLERNVEANCLTSQVSVHRLDFEDRSTFFGDGDSPCFDLVVGAEILYEEAHASHLARVFDVHVPAGCSSEVLLAYSHREEAPLNVFLSSMFEFGFCLERLEDQAHLVVAGVKRQVYDGSVFRPLGSADEAAEAIREAAEKGLFCVGNERRPEDGGTQILRFTRARAAVMA